MAEFGSNAMALAGTGVGLGIVHVLTGPDHLSALATLSAVSDLCTSFFLGVRWGIGHSTGLLLVGVALIIRDYSRDGNGSENASDVIDMPDALSHFFESIVGIFMICLGVYGFRRAFRKRHEFVGRIELPSNDDEDMPMEILETHLSLTGIGSYHDHPHHIQEACLDTLANIVSEQCAPSQTSMGVEVSNADGSSPEQGFAHMINSSKRFSARSMAILAGIIHGLAGPGGVLGVIPAVQLHDWKLATLYLTCFCVSSTLTMGCFACFYGSCSSSVGRKTQLEFQIHCFSAGLSVLVGITWLVLLAMGKLEDVFP